jgi:ABC-2 type transport system ATP-binding protein
VQFGDFLALADVSLRVRAGELVGLVGPNGAGKTTLLRALAGLLGTTAGRVEVMGERLHTGDAALMRHVGFTADEPPLYEAMTVRQFLRFVGSGYDFADAEVDERIDFWLEQVWLTEKADQKISSLSRGMRQRVGIARTLLPGPAVVLLDEPAAGLDPAGRAQFRRLLSSLREQRKGLIVSSHILSDLADYCTHIAIMSQGRILRWGTVAEISGGDDGSLVPYTLRILSSDHGIREQLLAVPGVADAEQQGDRWQIMAAPGDDAAADLLADLVKARIRISTFGLDGGGLERAYLRANVAQVD